jgi:predicted patatin/cPLA2 family phospholipase
MHSAKSPTSLQTDTIYQYFIENCKIFTAHATITDVSTDGYNLSVFYRELQNVYYTCHNHQCLYRRIQSVDISQRAGLFSSMSVQFIITNGLCKFQNIGINASLTACIYRRTYRQTVKFLEGQLQILVQNSKFTNRSLKFTDGIIKNNII